MKIAIDWDETFTADREFFQDFIMLARKYGHKTYIVTMRSSQLDAISEADDLLYNYETDIIYCDGQPKRKICESLGHFFDIFIDDKPEGICNGSSFTADQLAIWREEQKLNN